MDRDIKARLAAAAGEGIITSEQASRLQDYFALKPAAEPAMAASEAASEADRSAEPGVIVDTESPRFIRGFHDVLITIGIVIVLIGIWGVGSFYAALPGIIVLAEILVRRQRLALPAVALTIALVHWVALVAGLTLDAGSENVSPLAYCLEFLLPFPLVLAPFYWRYRVPLSLALLCMSIAGLLLVLVFFLLEQASGAPDFILTHRFLSSAIFLAAALALFTLAMRFDLRDPERRTRNSDVAFWLHLGAAPALLYGMLAFVFLDDVAGIGAFPQTAATSDALLVVLIVIVFMGVGLIIDRRAFVTSGLLSLGFAIFRIFQQVQLEFDLYVFITLLIVGVVVLTIGIGWPYFRRAVVGRLPEGLKAKLPPLR